MTLADVTTGPELEPLLSGTSSYVGGTFVWTDYAYDDRGANDPNADPAEEQGGDVEYPPGLQNYADLIQLQIDRDAAGVAVTAILETLVEPNVPVLGVAFDRDGDHTTGAPSLPGVSWTPLGTLGVDHFLVVSSAGAQLFAYSAGAWTQIAALPALVDPVTNVMQATIPPALADPGNDAWRVFAGVAINDPNGSSLLSGGPIRDLAFVAETNLRRWQSIRQADVLAGTLASSQAATFVDFAKVAAGVTDLAEPPVRGFHSRLYHSSLNLPEGVAATGGMTFLGPYQPYVVWLPGPGSRPPLMLYLHPARATHTGDVFLYESNPMYGTSSAAGWSTSGQVFGDDPDNTELGPVAIVFGGVIIVEDPFAPRAVIVIPLGRASAGGYSGINQQDVLDVMADATSRFETDPQRTFLTGISMGGLGTFRLGALYPDRWSFGFSSIGSSSPLGTVDNLRNLPVRMYNGRVDPLVNSVSSTNTANRLGALGYDYRFWLMERRQHEHIQPLIRCVYLQGLAARRPANPARVTYKVIPSMFQVDPVVGYDLRYSGAYWVSDMLVRDGASEGIIDALSLARADRSPTTTPFSGTQENNTAGRDVCGPNPDVQTQDVWNEQGIVYAPGPDQPVSNGMQLTLTALESAALDLPRMSLSTVRCLTIESTGDGSSTLELIGPWSGPVQVLRDGVPHSTLTPQGDRVELAADFAGEHGYLLVPPEVPAADIDADGLASCEDNCPFAFNPAQEDEGGIGSGVPDGIGNACQCGDVTGDGDVDGQDGIFMARHGLGFDDPSFVVTGNCDVTGNGICNGQDGYFTLRAGLGFLDPPSLAPRGQNCPNARGSAL